MAHFVNYKMPRARKVSEFIVYPFSKGDEKILLQSDNHCMIVYVDKASPFAGTTNVSPRYPQYPVFAACHPAYGGKRIETPKEIQEQVDAILLNPTGKIVTL